MNNTVICIECHTEYKFGEKWFDKHDIKTFVCRTCKIKKTTKSNNFRKQASIKSKEILSDHNIKSRMSQIATINNIKNSEKISESLKTLFKNQKLKDQLGKEIKNRWKNPNYRNKICNSIKLKWTDPNYRGRVLGSRVKLNKKSLKNQYDNCIDNFNVGAYTFDAFINEKYLYDKKFSKEKALYIEHNFVNLIYINDLNQIKI